MAEYFLLKDVRKNWKKFFKKEVDYNNQAISIETFNRYFTEKSSYFNDFWEREKQTIDNILNHVLNQQQRDENEEVRQKNVIKAKKDFEKFIKSYVGGFLNIETKDKNQAIELPENYTQMLFQLKENPQDRELFLNLSVCYLNDIIQNGQISSADEKYAIQSCGKNIINNFSKKDQINVYKSLTPDFNWSIADDKNFKKIENKSASPITKISPILGIDFKTKQEFLENFEKEYKAAIEKNGRYEMPESVLKVINQSFTDTEKINFFTKYDKIDFNKCDRLQIFFYDDVRATNFLLTNHSYTSNSLLSWVTINKRPYKINQMLDIPSRLASVFKNRGLEIYNYPSMIKSALSPREHIFHKDYIEVLKNPLSFLFYGFRKKILNQWEEKFLSMVNTCGVHDTHILNILCSAPELRKNMSFFKYYDALHELSQKSIFNVLYSNYYKTYINYIFSAMGYLGISANVSVPIFSSVVNRRLNNIISFIPNTIVKSLAFTLLHNYIKKVINNPEVVDKFNITSNYLSFLLNAKNYYTFNKILLDKGEEKFKNIFYSEPKKTLSIMESVVKNKGSSEKVAIALRKILSDNWYKFDKDEKEFLNKTIAVAAANKDYKYIETILFGAKNDPEFIEKCLKSLKEDPKIKFDKTIEKLFSRVNPIINNAKTYNEDTQNKKDTNQNGNNDFSQANQNTNEQNITNKSNINSQTENIKGFEKTKNEKNNPNNIINDKNEPNSKIQTSKNVSITEQFKSNTNEMQGMAKEKNKINVSYQKVGTIAAPVAVEEKMRTHAEQLIQKFIDNRQNLYANIQEFKKFYKEELRFNPEAKAFIKDVVKEDLHKNMSLKDNKKEIIKQLDADNNFFANLLGEKNKWIKYYSQKEISSTEEFMKHRNALLKESESFLKKYFSDSDALIRDKQKFYEFYAQHKNNPFVRDALISDLEKRQGFYDQETNKKIVEYIDSLKKEVVLDYNSNQLNTFDKIRVDSSDDNISALSSSGGTTEKAIKANSSIISENSEIPDKVTGTSNRISNRISGKELPFGTGGLNQAVNSHAIGIQKSAGRISEATGRVSSEKVKESINKSLKVGFDKFDPGQTKFDLLDFVIKKMEKKREKKVGVKIPAPGKGATDPAKKFFIFGGLLGVGLLVANEVKKNPERSVSIIKEAAKKAKSFQDSFTKIFNNGHETASVIKKNKVSREKKDRLSNMKKFDHKKQIEIAKEITKTIFKG